MHVLNVCILVYVHMCGICMYMYVYICALYMIMCFMYTCVCIYVYIHVHCSMYIYVIVHIHVYRVTVCLQHIYPCEECMYMYITHTYKEYQIRMFDILPFCYGQTPYTF